MKQTNALCHSISAVAREGKCFNKSQLHRRCYHSSRASSGLSAPITVRCIGKVADACKADKRVKKGRKPPENELARVSFRPLGATICDARILSYMDAGWVSIRTTGGRIRC